MPDTSTQPSQVSLVPLPAAVDCARHDLSGGLRPGDGLLPIPQSHGQARALSKKSIYPSKPSSVFFSPLVGRSAASAYPTVKKLSRSASAILPTPTVGSPPGVEGDGLNLLKGRLPFKIVQGNGPGISKADGVSSSILKKPKEAKSGGISKADGVLSNVPEKHKEAKSGVSKKMSAANRPASNVKVKDGLQRSWPTSKPSNYGGCPKALSRKVSQKIDRCLQRSSSAKGSREKCEKNGVVPVITILQRPQSKEAAVELLTKFLQASVDEEVLRVHEQPVNSIADNLLCHPDTIEEIEIEQQKCAGVSSDSETSKGRSVQSVSSLCTTGTLASAASKVVRGNPGTDTVKIAISLVSETQVDGVSLNSSRGSLGDECEDLSCWERWAGPCYINSPPPSALPLPRFYKRELRIESAVTPGLLEEIVSERVSTPPPSVISPSCAWLSDRHQWAPNLKGVVAGTAGLKRILNLDLSRL